MHSETSNDLSQAGLHIAIQDIKDELFDTPECDYAIAQLLTRWGQAEKADQVLDEMLMKWGTSPEVLALTQRGYTEMVGSSELSADNDGTIRKPQETTPAALDVVAA
jgi:pentatricopeptide repeat protein